MRITCIDFFRTVATFAIITIHTSPFREANKGIFHSLCIAMDQVARFAVPYFFVVAGYFFGRKVLSGISAIILFKQYAKRFLPLHFVWSVIYIVLPTDIKSEVLQYGFWDAAYQKLLILIADPEKLLLQGGRGHLWFLLALLSAIGIISVFLQTGKQKWLLPVASLLYLFGLLTSSYSVTGLGFEVPFGTRNGPFFSTLLVTIGWIISYMKPRVGPVLSILTMIIGCLLYACEVLLLHKIYDIPIVGQQFMFGSIFCATGLTMFAISSPNLFAKSWATKWAPYTLGIYLIHQLISDLLTPLSMVVPFPLWDILYPFVVYALSLMSVLIISKHKLSKFLVHY
jgi:surface polysaccharide O-acyltransferase-like enzyme